MAIAIIIMLLLAVGCTKVEKVEKAKPEPERIDKSRFMEVERTNAWKIIADRETGVMYAVSYGGYNIGTFTLLVDADGNPLIYKGGQDVTSEND